MFDTSKLLLKPLSARQHDLDISVVKDLKAPPPENRFNPLEEVGRLIRRAKQRGSSTTLMIGAHVLRSGVQRFIIDLMQKGYLTCLAMNGAGVIHDFELALIGATTESVSRYIRDGQFGLWKETGQINDILSSAYAENGSAGLGESVGKAIANSDYPFREVSLLANAFRYSVVTTVHVGIGYDIIHEHPNCSGAAIGALSYNDFLKFAGVLQTLQNGVVMNFGSSVMAPEVFLKGLSMARNVARQQGETINRFATLVCDLHDLPTDFGKEPPKDSPAYYFRPWKTMLVRTVQDGGRSFYVKGRHEDTIPALWAAVMDPDAD